MEGIPIAPRTFAFLALGFCFFIISANAHAADASPADAKFKEAMLSVAREEVHRGLVRLEKKGMLVREMVASATGFAPTEADKNFIAGMPARYKVSGTERIRIKNLKRRGNSWSFSLRALKVNLDTEPLGSGKVLINGKELSFNNPSAEPLVKRVEEILGK